MSVDPAFFSTSIGVGDASHTLDENDGTKDSTYLTTASSKNKSVDPLDEIFTAKHSKEVK